MLDCQLLAVRKTMGNKKIILDHVTGLEASQEDCFNEIMSLESLRLGLFQLAAYVWKLEEQIRSEQTTHGIKVFSYGNVPQTNRVDNLLLPCYFHWFGVSLCNYVRLVGFIWGIETGRITREYLNKDSIKKECKDYIDTIPEIQEVLVWRNKVAAHFAITDPHKTDNIATLDMSVIYPVSFSDDRYRVHKMTLIRSSADGQSHTSDLPSWSITKTWEDLSARYWSEFVYPV